MQEQIISPNTFLNESDKSAIQRQPQVVGAALVGPTVKGRPFIPTYVTTYTEFEAVFGSNFVSGGYSYEYFTSLAAKEWFDNGGDTLLVTKVVSGSANINTYASSNVLASGSAVAFSLETLAWGDQANSSGSQSSTGVLANGTENNVRWEITNADTGSGLFDLVIRSGNDFTAQKNYLETFTGLSLDPQLPNFISRVIGDQKQQYIVDADGDAFVRKTGSYPVNSEYVRVSSVSIIPNSVDETGTFKSTNISKLPLPASGSFSGGVAATNLIPNFFETCGVVGDKNLQGFTPDDYNRAFSLLMNKDEYRFNKIIAPGVTLEDAAGDNLAALSQGRNDNISIIDPVTFGKTIGQTVQAASSINTSFSAMYWPWCQIWNANLGKSVWVPASIVMLGVYAYSKRVGQPWSAPAGMIRGGIPSVIDVERKLESKDRDKLYKANINPLATFPGEGVVAWGQKTAQKKNTALDRVNVRLLLIEIKEYVDKVARPLLFEQNTIVTRNKFESQVNPYLETVVSREGLYAFKVTMDESNNTSDVIDRNQLVGTIQLQPTKTVEFIILNFNITPTGATFD